MRERIAAIKLLLLDVDGILTDGSIVYSDQGVEFKRFHVRDGAGIKAWQQTGRQVAILSGRSSAAVNIRATELGIAVVLQGQRDKLVGLNRIQELTGVAPKQMVYLGDDLPDLPVLTRVGMALTVADACPEVRAKAEFVTQERGGQGAVREAIEWLLKQTGEWDQVLSRHQI